MLKVFSTIVLLLFSTQVSAIQTSQLYFKTCKTHGTKQDTRIFTRCVRNNFERLNREIDDLYLSKCPVVYSMRQSVENCHNSNFRKVDFELNLSLRQCQNFGSEVSVSYQYCVNRNFRDIEQMINFDR